MNYVLIPLFALMQVFFAACCFTNTRPGDGAMEAWRWFAEDLGCVVNDPWGWPLYYLILVGSGVLLGY